MTPHERGMGMNLDYLRDVFKGNLAEIIRMIKNSESKESIERALYVNSYNIKDSTRMLEEDLRESCGGEEEIRARLKIIGEFANRIGTCGELLRSKLRGDEQADAECDGFAASLDAWS